MGPIPAGFEASGGELVIGGKPARAWVEQAGQTPLFLYSREMIDRRIGELRDAMPDRLSINYAVKANPFQPLVEHMRDLVDGFDIASAGELELIKHANIDTRRVSFAGPGKREEELVAAIAHGVTLNCESEREAEKAMAAGERLGIAPRIAIRANPDFELRGSGMKMGGGAKQFGLDSDRVAALAKRLIASGADWRGFHIFAGSQSLDADAIIETQANVLKLARELTSEVGEALPKLNMGGGFGIPYFNGDQPLDIVRIGSALERQFANLSHDYKETEFCIELGRYLVGEAGIYLTRIVERKLSHGELFLITDGGLHHQLAASGNFGTVVRRNYPLANAGKFGEKGAEVASVVGCLCTPLDRLGDRIELPKSEEGDLLAVFCAGAYGASASPSAFLGQGPAEELLV
jgi:diaminopimelate decarboxylase